MKINVPIKELLSRPYANIGAAKIPTREITSTTCSALTAAASFFGMKSAISDCASQPTSQTTVTEITVVSLVGPA